ncbi:MULTISPECIES: hypothetical protein [Borreliella]|uniref:Uncharacterized protein n=1 Tax=Borrelia garinii subsp. bavariensis (strain ATCC BAA-2496 / DSM 23469 / PBi) TaxID=290434 RepID=A0A7I6GXQ5_BORGP|nr:hypothetical protein [Borreliella bavariensis]AAU86046.1 hypothetical protein BGP195 [Borreliella bavariensis PBi]
MIHKQQKLWINSKGLNLNADAGKEKKVEEKKKNLQKNIDQNQYLRF